MELRQLLAVCFLIVCSGMCLSCYDNNTKTDTELLKADTTSGDTPGGTIVRVDTSASRAFVVASDEAMNHRSTRLQLVSEVRRDVTLKGLRFISVFNNADCAGYKTDEEIAPCLELGAFQKACIGEFDLAGRVVTIYPLLPEKVMKDSLPALTKR